MVRSDWSRDTFTRHQSQWHQHQERAVVEPTYDEGRFHEPNDTRRPPLNIEKALREHCNIPARHFFVAAILDDGTAQTFSGPGRNHPNSVSKFFSMDAFRRQVKKTDAGATGPMHDDPELGYAGDQYRQQLPPSFGSGPVERRRQGSEAFGEEDYRMRKRTRGYRKYHEEDSDIPSVAVGAVTKGLKIGNSDEVWDFYDQRFRNCQQTACKLIAKAWVKVVEPKKQTNHPYTGQEEKAPDWWPKPWGTTKDEKVRHKEPDHLYKRERVHLLCHILRMIVEPNERQHESIQKMNLTVEKLKDATDEALSLFFSPKENHKNAKKKPYLDEIFKVALSEQRYKHGEIDADTQVFVMAEERFPGAGTSENDDGAAIKDECEPQSASSASPSKSTTATNDGLLHGSGHDQSPTGALQGSSYMGELPSRGTGAYAPQMLPPNIQTEQHFVENERLHPSSGIPMHDMGPGPHETHRRPSLYASPTDYSNPQSTGIYSQPWQPGTTGPSSTSVYQFASTPTPGSQFGGHSNVPLPPNQYMATQYDSGMSRGSYDQGAMFPAATNPSQPHVQSSQGFPAYNIGPDGRSMSAAGVKPDTLPRSH